MMNPMMLGAVIRWALTIAGASELFSEDQMNQLLGAMVTLATLGWSLWQKHKASKPAY